MKEVCAITAIHSGFDAVGEVEVNFLADVAIEFILRLGKSIRQECDRNFVALRQSAAHLASTCEAKRIEELDRSIFIEKVVSPAHASMLADVRPISTTTLSCASSNTPTSFKEHQDQQSISALEAQRGKSVKHNALSTVCHGCINAP